MLSTALKKHLAIDMFYWGTVICSPFLWTWSVKIKEFKRHFKIIIIIALYNLLICSRLIPWKL